MGLNGYNGQGRFGASDLPEPMAKLKLVPGVHYAFNPSEGLRLALGIDPTSVGGTNAMTDMTAYAVFYQFLQ